MTKDDAVAVVKKFWNEVWQSPHNVDAIDDLVAEDFILTTGGMDVVGRAAFKEWVRQFQSKIGDCQFNIREMFSTDDGSRVATRWQVRGRNNGLMGTRPDGHPVELTGLSIIQVAPDGRLLHNWVERSAWEAFNTIKGRQQPD